MKDENELATSRESKNHSRHKKEKAARPQGGKPLGKV